MPSFRRKTCNVLTAFVASASMVFAGGAAFADIAPTALPTGGTVTAGNASISQQGANLTVNQTTQRTIINWQSFDIGSGAQVTFNQPNSASVALNRVLSATPSTINGKLTANGQVWLINPAGMVFGAGSAVNVGGLVASTMDIADGDFMAGKNVFNRDGSTGSIVNQGTITASPGGVIALLAPELRNEGVLSAQLGTVVLAAGEQVTLDIATAGGPVTVQVTPAQIATLIENRSIIVAQSGAVILSAKAADALLGSTINNSGAIEASSLTSAGGTIQLVGATDITNTGTLDASGTSGGLITVAADQAAGQATIGGTVSVAGTNGVGGKAVITGNHVIIDDGARVDATGTAGGGEIDAGGSWEGEDASIPESTGTYVAPTAVLDASATVSGNGGTVVARSDVTNPNSVTRAYGTFLAKGGPQGGNGGRVETSGYWLDITGAQGGASAALGSAGMWLLDPYDVTISSSVGSNGSFSGGTWTASGTGSNVQASVIQGDLEGGTNVTISTAGAGSDNGNLTVNNAILKTTGNTDVTLTLQAANNITLNAAINNSGGSGKLNVNLDADSDANGSGIVILSSNITTGGGYLKFGANTTATVNGVSTLVGGDVYVSSGSALTLSTGGGAVNVYGQMLIADPSGLTISTAGGNAAFSGLIDSGDSYTLVHNVSGLTWQGALNDAQSGTGASVGDTYLATVTSRLEGQVVSNTTYTAGAYQATWLGGRRVVGEGTDAVWRWVTGPEGLIFSDGANGLAFFTQNAGGSGTPINGAYTNWNGSEPNNSGGGGSLAVDGESALQTLATNSAAWNDLPYNSGTLNYYVKETNLADSPLTVNAGAGSVTFSGAVGSNKQLASLNVTGNAIAINGGSVSSTGSQTYTGPVTLGASATSLTVSNGNFTSVASESIDNTGSSNETLSITASGDVEISSTSSIAATGSGSLGVTLTSQGGAVKLDSTSHLNSNGGAITLVANTLTVDSTATAQGGSSGSLTIKPYTSTTAMGVGTGAAGALSLGNGLFTSNFINNTFGTVTLGGSNTGLVTVGNTFALANKTIIESDANLAFTASADVTASGILGLKLDNSGTASENSASVINAGSLALTGAGATFTLNNGTNTAANFAANTGTINYINQGSLTVGTVNGTAGVTATGDTTLQTVGATADMTLNSAVSSSGGNVVLAAGRNFVNNLSSNTGIVASGGGKHYYVYSADPADSTEGMTGYSKHYNQTYTAGSVPTYASSGNWFFYTIAPVLTVAPVSNSVVYGNADPAITLAYTSGFLDGDTSSTSGITGSGGSTIASFTASGAGFRPAGSYSIAATLGNLASSLGYTFSVGTPGTLTVNTRGITLAGFTASDKAYDGTTAATISGYGSLGGVLSGDSVAGASGTANFADTAVGNGKTVTGTNFGVGGADGGDYHITTASLTTTATITPPEAEFVSPTVPTPEDNQSSPTTPQQQQPQSQQQSQQQTSPFITGGSPDIKFTQGSFGSQGVVVTEIRSGIMATPGILVTIGNTEGFSFDIPPHSLEDSFGKESRGRVLTSLAGGGALPSWLSYDPAHHVFSAADVPPGGLPLVVSVTVPGSSRSLEITISL